MPVYHFTTPIEYLGFSFTYYYLLYNKRLKWIISISTFALIIISIIDTLFFETLFSFPSNLLMSCEFIYLIYSLIGFRQMFIHPTEQPLVNQSFFWLNSALLFYTCNIFLHFGLLQFFINHKLSTIPLSTYAYYTNIAFYLLLGICLFTEKNSCFNGQHK